MYEPTLWERSGGKTLTIARKHAYGSRILVEPSPVWEITRDGKGGVVLCRRRCIMLLLYHRGKI